MRDRNGRNRLGSQSPARKFSKDRRALVVIAGVNQKNLVLSDWNDANADDPIHDDARAVDVRRSQKGIPSRHRRRQRNAQADHDKGQNRDNADDNPLQEFQRRIPQERRPDCVGGVSGLALVWIQP